LQSLRVSLCLGKHYDTSDTDSLGRQTLYTVLIYLSECGGGETVFYEEHGGGETARVAPDAGGAGIYIPRPALLCMGDPDGWQPAAAGQATYRQRRVVLGDTDGGDGPAAPARRGLLAGAP
jgi:hypothetical protein